MQPNSSTVQNPFTGTSVDYGRPDLAKIASDNLKNGVDTAQKQGTLGQAQGQFNPLVTASQLPQSGFNSSSQPIVNFQGSQGVASAISSITGQQNQAQSPQGTPSNTTPAGGGMPIDFNSFMQGAAQLVQNSTGAQLNALGGAFNLQLQNAALANTSIGLQYNTALGGLNQQYNQAFQSLQTQHMNSIGAAVSQMAIADPMGVQSSSFASGYVGKVNDMYSQQAGFLNAAYGQQQVALQNGMAGAAIQIQQQINSAQANFGQQIAQVLAGQNQAFMQIAQTGLGIAQFGYSRQLQSQSLFESTMKGTNLMGVTLPDGKPLMETDASGNPTGKMTISMQDLGDNGKGVTPRGESFMNWLQGTSMFAQGIASGYSPQQIAQAVINGTTQQYNSLLQTRNTNLKYAEAMAAGVPVGGGTGGGGGTGTQASLSPLAQQISQTTGGASLTYAKGGEKVLTEFNNLNSAATQSNLSGLIDFAKTGNSNAFTSALGPLVNGFFGTNVGDFTSAKDYMAAGLALGVDGKTLQNLANQSSETRGKVVEQILTKLKSQMSGAVSTYRNSYDLKPLSQSISSSENNINAAITAVKGGGTAATGATNQGWGNYSGFTPSFGTFDINLGLTGNSPK